MNFLTYKKFNDRESAEAIGESLAKGGIDFEITEDRDSIGDMYGDRTFTKSFYVNIASENFVTADAIVLKAEEESVAAVSKDHYLYSFTDEELFDLLSKPDEWNALDYQLSQKILKERGKEITPETLALIKSQRIKTLSMAEPRQRGLVAAGYIFAFISGVVGVFIGWHLATNKKILPDGTRVYGFQKEDRANGRIIMIIGSIIFVIGLIARFS